jgi:hypothetical protein
MSDNAYITAVDIRDIGGVVLRVFQSPQRFNQQ